VVAPTGYVRMSDGTLIAVNVRLPDHYQAGQRYPSVFYYDGYEGASGRPADRGAGSPWYTAASQSDYQNTQSLNRGVDQAYNSDFVTVHVSIRGTGCSGGSFQLFSPQSDLDGKEVIDWMARQPWSDGRVGIVGHSYSGIEGLRVAATQPKPLVAVMVGGVIDDIVAWSTRAASTTRCSRGSGSVQTGRWAISAGATAASSRAT
jgi:putative CocE/NonD family hydrolase